LARTLSAFRLRPKPGFGGQVGGQAIAKSTLTLDDCESPHSHRRAIDLRWNNHPLRKRIEPGVEEAARLEVALAKDQRRNDVAALQNGLDRALQPGRTSVRDGIFGPPTEGAVRAFRTCQGLTAAQDCRR
jgi:hypothetical protein